MGAKKKKARQVPIQDEMLPLLKKPFEQVGKQVEIPGEYWQLASGRMSQTEMNTKFKCTIRDFSYAQVVRGDSTPVKALQLQEMGETGTGSVEEGDASGFQAAFIPPST